MKILIDTEKFNVENLNLSISEGFEEKEYILFSNGYIVETFGSESGAREAKMLIENSFNFLINILLEKQ